jgi:mono/diheme cytochrome c family protein
MMKTRWLWLTALVLCQVASAGEAELTLKDGAGREKVASQCSVCHSLDYIAMNAPIFDRKGWEASVTKMIKVMGAPIPSEDVVGVVDYLTTYYGR